MTYSQFHHFQFHHFSVPSFFRGIFIVPSFHRSIVPSFWNARATCARATCVRVGGATRLEPRASTTRPPRVSSCRPNYVFTTTGARGFLVSARRRWELRFGELLLDPLYHAPTPFVSSEPCTPVPRRNLRNAYIMLPRVNTSFVACPRRHLILALHDRNCYLDRLVMFPSRLTNHPSR